MVERYEPCFLEEYNWTPIEPHEDGDYVLFTDYERLEQTINVLTEQADLRAAEIKRLEAELASERQSVNDLSLANQKLIKERDHVKNAVLETVRADPRRLWNVALSEVADERNALRARCERLTKIITRIADGLNTPWPFPSEATEHDNLLVSSADDAGEALQEIGRILKIDWSEWKELTPYVSQLRTRCKRLEAALKNICSFFSEDSHDFAYTIAKKALEDK